MAIRLFVSHSSKDAPFVERLLELVRAALELRRSEIRCTSVDGYRLEGGAHTDEQLRREVMAADVCLGIITPEALDSLYVAFELGARWGADKPIIPLLGPGVEPSALRGPLGGINALRSTRAGLHQLVTDLGKQLGRTPEPPHAYERHLAAIFEGGAGPGPTDEGGRPRTEGALQAGYEDLVLFTMPQGGFLAVESRRVEAQDSRDPWSSVPSAIHLDVIPGGGEAASGIRSLRGQGHGVGIAYGTDAYVGRVAEVRQIREGGEERWRVVFEPSPDRQGGILGDVATEGYSGDDIAELRARRILLGEALPGRRGHGYDALDGFVRGMGTAVQVDRSPFPMLREEVGLGDVGLFLAVCRLLAVLWLRATGTVAEVWRLELALVNEDTLRVDFEGQRRRQYENADPVVIRVEGECSLTTSR